jgi:phosphohistidine phosphatase
VPGPYELYLIRHAVAEERGASWPDDAKRPLTGAGTDRMRKAARGLVRIGVRLDVVLSSPFVRTRQTAEAVASAFEERPPIVVIESLAPGGSIQSVLSDLERQARRSRVALVGHEPGIGELAARLAGARYPIEFKKGAICRIDVKTFPAGPGKLRWFATTKILRAVRK